MLLHIVSECTQKITPTKKLVDGDALILVLVRLFNVVNLSTKGTFAAMFAYQRVLLQHLGHYQTKMKNLGFVQQGSRVVYPWHQAKGVLIMISYIHMYFFIVLLFL